MLRRLTSSVTFSDVLKRQLSAPFHITSLYKIENFAPNLTFFALRKLHLSAKNHDKLFVNVENEYAFGLLPEIPKFNPSWSTEKPIESMEHFEEFLNQNWRGSNGAAIVEAFEKLKDFTISNNLTFADKRFDKLVDGLMDHCEELSDDELFKLLVILTEYPQCEASTSHNFHDVWSCLDDMCCWKMSNWDNLKLFAFAEVWYKWNLARLSDFVFQTLDRTTQKPQRLSKNMLLYTLFYINVNRRLVIPFQLEHVLEERIGEFNVDELAIIAMGYFKTKAKIKPAKIVNAMIKAINDNCEEINEISLTALLKAIRLTQKADTIDEIPPMLDKLIPQIPRLSTACLIHIALTGTSLQIKHEESLMKCTERIFNEIENIRLKEIERILVACGIFNIDTNPSIFEKAAQEITKESRRQEFVQYNRCLPSILHFLSFRQIYCYSLMNELLNEEFINETYGKSSKNLPRDIFVLDVCIDIDCPDYKGTRLSAQKRYKAVKWQTEWTPRLDQPKRLSLPEKVYLEIAETVKDVVGAERLLRHDHVLPHFSKSDIILCQDRTSGEFIEPFGFDNYVLGDVKRPSEGEKYKWFAVVVLTPNLTVRDTAEPLGGMVMKERQLKSVGYHPIMVYTSLLAPLSPPERVEFMKSMLI